MLKRSIRSIAAGKSQLPETGNVHKARLFPGAKKGELTSSAERADFGNQRILVFENEGHTTRRDLFKIAYAKGTDEKLL